MEATVLGLLFTIERFMPGLASRLLPIPLIAVLMLAMFLNHSLYGEALYLRAHKREPLLVLSIMIATLTGAGTFVAARLWGAAGVAVGYFLTGGLFPLAAGSLIFFRLRRLWHGSLKHSLRSMSGVD